MYHIGHFDGTTRYYNTKGEFHRENGPAVIYSDGYTEWWINGVCITDKVNFWANERNIDLDNMSEMDKVILKTEMKIWIK